MEEEVNTLLPGDGGSIAKLSPVLDGIVNGEVVLAYEE